MSGRQNEALAVILSMIREGELDGREDEIYKAFKARRRVRDSEALLQFHDQDRVAFKADKSVLPVHLRGAKGVVRFRGGKRSTRIPVLIDIDSTSSYAGSIVDAYGSSLVKL